MEQSRTFGIEKVEHQCKRGRASAGGQARGKRGRLCKSSRDSLSEALKAAIRLLISRSWRFSRSVSVSSDTNCSRKAFTSAEEYQKQSKWRPYVPG